MNGTLDNRVLGRVLAMEEIADVSGAKQTLPRFDQITVPDGQGVGDSNYLMQEAGRGNSLSSGKDGGLELDYLR